MDPTLSTLQMQLQMGSAHEVQTELPGMDPAGEQPDHALANKFQALMNGADGAGVPTAPIESSGAAGTSAAGRIIESQDSIVNNAFSDAARLPDELPSMSVMESVGALTRVAAEVTAANFQVTANMTVANTTKSSAETLLKNQ